MTACRCRGIWRATRWRPQRPTQSRAWRRSPDVRAHPVPHCLSADMQCRTAPDAAVYARPDDIQKAVHAPQLLLNRLPESRDSSLTFACVSSAWDNSLSVPKQRAVPLPTGVHRPCALAGSVARCACRILHIACRQSVVRYLHSVRLQLTSCNLLLPCCLQTGTIIMIMNLEGYNTKRWVLPEYASPAVSKIAICLAGRRLAAHTPMLLLLQVPD